MMMNTTIEQLRGLRLAGMASGLEEQLTQAGMTAISFEERFALLVDREVHWRNDKRQTRLLKDARLKYSQASIEDLDTRAGRGVDRKAVMSLALGDWIDSGHCVLITGPVRMPPGTLRVLPASAALGGGVAHSPWQWNVWQVVTSTGQDGCAVARRLGDGRH